jgi:hypothetical protein
VEAFLRDDGSTVTHGICPDCLADLQRRQLSAWADRRKGVMPTALDNGRRSPRKLLAVVVHRLILALKRQ